MSAKVSIRRRTAPWRSRKTNFRAEPWFTIHLFASGGITMKTRTWFSVSCGVAVALLAVSALAQNGGLTLSLKKNAWVDTGRTNQAPRLSNDNSGDLSFAFPVVSDPTVCANQACPTI